MHSLNLGYGLWVSGSTLILMVEQFQLWGPCDEKTMEQCYKSAWLHFQGWTVANKIRHLSPSKTFVVPSQAHAANLQPEALHQCDQQPC